MTNTCDCLTSLSINRQRFHMERKHHNTIATLVLPRPYSVSMWWKFETPSAESPYHPFHATLRFIGVILTFDLYTAKNAMSSAIGKCKLFRIKLTTLLEGEIFLRNKHQIEFFEIKWKVGYKRDRKFMNQN